MKPPTLRPYQLEAGSAVEAAFLDHGQNRLLVKKPTGTGKTVWFAALLTAFERLKTWLDDLPPTEQRMLVIAHREELLDQALEKIQRQNPGKMVSIEQGDRHANSYSDIVVASIQTLSAMKFRRLKRLLARVKFSIVLVDEAHHAAAGTYRTALGHLGFLPMVKAEDGNHFEAATHDDVEEMKRSLEGWDLKAPKDRLLIGVTATPNRSDAIGLGCVFQSIAFTYGLKQAIDDGWLVPIKPWVVETAESLDDVRTSRGDFNQKDLAEAVNNHRRNRLAIDAWRLYANGLPTIGFTVDVQHAHDLADMAIADGIKAAALSGETPKDERRQMIADYKAGRLTMIFNCMVLTEGTDLPLTRCILHAKPTKSATLYEQMTGRGLRPHPDDPVGPARVNLTDSGRSLILKPDCIVIDVVDVARRHSLQAAPVLYGLPPSLKTKGESLQTLADELEGLRVKHPGFDIESQLNQGRFSVRELLDRASTFDVWTVPEMGPVGAGLAMNWLRSGTDTFRLQYPWSDGMEILTVQRNMLQRFDLSATLRPSNGDPARQRTIATDVETAQGALQIAEAFILHDRRTVMRITSTDAPWRSRPASPKQIGLLRRLRVPLPAGTITMGKASDLINMAKARQGR